MSAYVCVDASVAAKWCLPEQGSDLALALYERCQRAGTTIAAPPHFAVEVTNAIRRRVARGLLSYAEGQELLRVFTRFSVRLVVLPQLYEEAFALAEAFGRPTVYDTHYVAVAKLLACDLWTADESLFNALGGKLAFVKPLQQYRLTG